MTDANAHARSVIERTTYMVLATADAGGAPWATPVWFAADGLDVFYWISWPGSKHSLLIDHRPEVAITVFDSTAAPLAGTGFYAVARARQCAGEEIDHGLQVYNRRSIAQGIAPFTLEQLSGPARLRLYRADIAEAWVLDQDAPVDQRAPVPR